MMADSSIAEVSTRRDYVGGGSIAAVLGLSPFSTVLDVYHQVIGDSPDLDAETLRFFKRRRAVEPFAAVLLEERGYQVLRQNERYQDPFYPFFKAEIDAEVIRPGTDERRVNVEIKSCHPLATRPWGEDGDPDGVPAYVAAQALWGLGITGATSALCMAAIGFDEDRVYPVHRDEDVIGWMRSKALTFWDDHVLKRIPPPPTTVADILKWIEPDPAKVIEASDYGLADVAQEWLQARLLAKDAEGAADTLKARLQIAMSDATTLTLDGKPIIRWKRNKDSVVTDHKQAAQDALKLIPPEQAAAILAGYTSTKPGNRPFTVVGR